jgi:alpha-glucosidase
VNDAAWWRRAVLYEIYCRSFQDSDGDGIGDLRGIEGRLDHVVKLGADAIWLSPIYPSPMADFGYDVSDLTAIDPVFGTVEDFDALVRAAHDRGLRVVMDLTPSHTSIEHPWFRDHPERYVRVAGGAPPNNWETAFGTPAWSPDPLRPGWWYLHSFYPEQPNLDWSNPDVGRAMQDVVRFWIDRGVDGFRLDSAERIGVDPELRDDPPRRHPPALPDLGSTALDPVHSRNGPTVASALAQLRTAAGDRLLVGELYLPTPHVRPYLEHVDIAFCFELLHAPFRAAAIRRAIQRALVPGVRADGLGWLLSNHDFPRLATRVGEDAARVAALLLLTLPGAAFVYQGDEIGLPNGPGGKREHDRAGRDGLRHPMQWDSRANGGFTSGEPWLPPIDPAGRSVEAQRSDAGSLLELYRRLIAFRRKLGEGFRLLDADPGVVAYELGGHTVSINTTAEERERPDGAVVLATHPGEGLPPHAGVIVKK